MRSTARSLSRSVAMFAALAVVAATVGLSLAACSVLEPPRPSLVFTPAQLPKAAVGQAFDTSVTVSSNVTPVGSIFVAKGKLPPGLSLAHVRGDSSAAFKGTPTKAGSYAFALGAWCLGTQVTGQSGQQAYVLVVR